MAGRGRRLGDLTPTSTSLGIAVPFPEEAFGEIEIFTDKVNEINLANNDQTLINAFEKLVKEKCTSKDLMKDVFTSLHEAALVNSDFGLKLITGIRNIICFEVEDVTLRNILLNLIQEDFAAKETLSKEKLLNAVMLLGYFYNKIDIGGNPIKVLGIALLEYFDLLLKRSPDDLKVLFIQVVINNGNLLNDNSLSEKYNAFHCNLRNALINGNLSEQSKCWVLRALEFMLISLKPSNLEVVEDFYTKKLGSNYSDLKTVIDNSMAALKKNNIDHGGREKKTSPKDREHKSNFKNDRMQRSNYFGRGSDESPRKKNDISERFSGLKMGKSDHDDFKNRKGNKMGGQQAHNKTPKKDFKKWNSEGRFQGGHDDRCEKDENFYGTQAPRLPRHGNQKKIFQDDKMPEKGDGDCKSISQCLNSSNESTEQREENQG